MDENCTDVADDDWVDVEVGRVETEFRNFDVSTWIPRLHNGEIYAMKVTLRREFDYCIQTSLQVKEAFEVIYDWMLLVQGTANPPPSMIAIGEKALNNFRTALLFGKNPSLSKARLRSRLQMTPLFSQRTHNLWSTGSEETKHVRCLRFETFGHTAATRNVRLPDYNGPRFKNNNKPRYSKNVRGAATRQRRRVGVAPIHNIPVNQCQRLTQPRLHPVMQVASRNRRPDGTTLSINDARLWDSESPTSPIWEKYLRTANAIAREMWAPSTWQQRLSVAGQFVTFCRAHRKRMNKESAAAFVASKQVAPSTGLQAARGSSYGSARDRPTRKTRGTFRSPTEYGPLSGTPHSLAHEGVRLGIYDAIGDFHGSFEPRIRPEEQKLEGDRSTITRRCQLIRTAAAEEETLIPLQQVQVAVLYIGWIPSRLTNDFSRRFQHICSLLGLQPRSHPRESSRAISVADAALLRDAGLITAASSLKTGSWDVLFSAIEEKLTGKRRRWMAWPREKNKYGPYKAEVPLEHISRYLPAVLEEAAPCLALKESFFQVEWPL
ncbi:hypothetical protein LSM04_001983 [Trypanosoma melophagium]|uniref:uncharacterized protein n=1 Tax=Trypanosoma melophagium TaxID=715481 RepID=UPI00351AA306|nr:hypothetical protein LSM04_001983 [Trypanosoma melophagium]